MSNQETYTYKGYDAVIMTDIGRADEKAYILARVQKWELRVTQRLEEFYQIGRKFPAAIHERDFKITGTIVKALWEPTMLKFVIGSEYASDRRRDVGFNQSVSSESVRARKSPEFEIVGMIKSEVLDESNAIPFKVVVKHAKLAEWGISISPNDYIIETCPFSATSILVIGGFDLKDKGGL